MTDYTIKLATDSAQYELNTIETIKDINEKEVLVYKVEEKISKVLLQAKIDTLKARIAALEKGMATIEQYEIDNPIKEEVIETPIETPIEEVVK